MSMRDIIKRLQEERATAWEEGKKLLELGEAEKRNLSAEEEGKWAAINADLDQKDARIKELLDVEQREIDADAARQRLAGLIPPTGAAPGGGGSGDSSMEGRVRAFLRGESRDLSVKRDKPMTLIERRVLSKLSAGAGANTVPTSFYDQLIAHLIEVSGIMMAGATVLTTDSGESLQIPKTTAHSTAALTTEGNAISASDPTFGQVTLGAFKYAVLVQVSNELISDTAVDLLGYLAMQCGRAVGNAAGVHFIVGTGGGTQPNGIIPGATVGVTGGTGVVGAFTADNLIDLHFSVIAPYRNSPACAWLMKDSTLGSVRKLKDTTNQYLWQPSLQMGAPDTLLGKAVYTDPNVVAPALSAKSVAFGDMSQYFIREVNGIRFERSDDFAFSSDLVTFRCIWRADGVLVDQTGAVKVFAGGAT